MTLPSTTGASIHSGGAPVLITMPNPDGGWSIVFNNDQNSNGGDVYVNRSGRSDGQWTRYRTPVGQGYSRNLTYVPQTGRVVILRGTFGAANPIQFGETDLGHSVGAYYQLVNRKTGAVLGTGNASQDSEFSGKRIYSETAGSVSDADTQWWHLSSHANGSVTLLNTSGGRAIGIWQGSSAAGAQLAQWSDEGNSDKRWNLVATSNGYYKLQSTLNTSLYATGGNNGTTVTTQNATTDGAQEWKLVPETDPISIEAVATTRCVAGKVYVVTTVKNTGETDADVTIDSSFGTKVFTALKPGKSTSVDKSTSVAQNTRQPVIGAGSVAVNSVETGGTATAGQSVAYAAQNCG